MRLVAASVFAIATLQCGAEASQPRTLAAAVRQANALAQRSGDAETAISNDRCLSGAFGFTADVTGIGRSDEGRRFVAASIRIGDEPLVRYLSEAERDELRRIEQQYQDALRAIRDETARANAMRKAGSQPHEVLIGRNPDRAAQDAATTRDRARREINERGKARKDEYETVMLTIEIDDDRAGKIARSKKLRGVLRVQSFAVHDAKWTGAVQSAFLVAESPLPPPSASTTIEMPTRIVSLECELVSQD
ncbi:MAG: hypothetical protein U1D55_15490 [Phycisphaerae bacterium]